MSIRTAASLVALSVVLLGCAADEEAPTVLPPIPSQPPTPTVVQVPSAAMPETQQGAAAFVGFFFAEVNRAYLGKDAEIVRGLATVECGSCAAVAADIDRLQRQGHMVPGRRYIISSAEASPADADGRFIVDIRFNDDPYVERDDVGTVVKEFASQGLQDGQVMLKRVDDRWRVLAIRLVSS